MFEGNHRNGPRFNPRKFRFSLGDPAVYKQWKIETGRNISLVQYRKILNALGTAMADSVIDERDGIRLPEGLGDVYMGFVKTTKRPIDFNTSEQYGKTIYHDNWETSGRPGKIIYGVHGRTYKHAMTGFWSFTAHTKFKIKSSAAFTSAPEKYKHTNERES